MERKLLVTGILGMLLFGGLGFSASQSTGKTSANQTMEGPAAPPWGMWYYCQRVKPDSPACQEFRTVWQEGWQKMREIKEMVWNEMREYCQNHPEDSFCRRGRGSCPCPKCNWHHGNWHHGS